MNNKLIVKFARITAIAGAICLYSSAGFAAGFFSSSSDDTPSDLPAVVKLIDAGNYSDAIVSLEKMQKADPENADVLNYLAYSQRKSGDLKSAEVNYDKALKINPDHPGALEYQGELYIQTGRIDMAKENLARLKNVCGTDCEQYEDLNKALAGK
ncbi:tetratricopeptide repeat protein [uncultured Thalassospira sp.]|jgi:Flp pilus assembly protein TadD|uniref:tetratricopeptide repeat protein n=1 Tax=uncultured Thalassospira sp. TaxID=404382 RepID=UPI0030DB48F7|tara:strand:- start:5688 stop:6152 length:465 start_codon:yes stop_codon:yes gene_type:complete